MASKLKVFVCEFITGGGLYNAPLPPSLAREGSAMLDALLTDLLDLPDVELITTRDPRLPVLTSEIEVRVPPGEDAVWPLWRQCMDEADAVWVIAPESGRVLEKISAMAGPKLLGCEPGAIRVAAGKRATALHLAHHGIPVVPTYALPEWPAGAARWVAKPDDGVGCEDTHLFEDATAVHVWLKNGRGASHVIQPWLDGEPASLSVLCQRGQAQLLSCNRQLIEVSQEGIHYRGSVLNGMAIHWDRFEAVAKKVAAALPGLCGYVGIDVIVQPEGQVTVLEINPRLTTSYVGLRRATGCNPAGLVLDLHYNGRFIEPGLLQRNIVEVKVDG